MMARPVGPRWRSRRLWHLASLLALALVFVAYLQPDLMFDLANFVWSCF
ncbi:MAG: hypothetical protein Q8L49_13610 [Burkholderiaceae bacterium]|nr:hypothetical protein [Burkholderiaceae bacterium]